MKWGSTSERGGEIIHAGVSINKWDLMKATAVTSVPSYYTGLYYSLSTDLRMRTKENQFRPHYTAPTVVAVDVPQDYSGSNARADTMQQ